MRIRELTKLGDMHCVCKLVEEIWHPGPGHSPVTPEFLRALAHSGNYLAGAFIDEQLIGACGGFFASPPQWVLHSHIAGTSPRVAGRHVGFALKLHQRAWALARGITTITWTFDPLVARNAYFNVVKLAALPAEYLPDFYGAMQDRINVGDDTDRLLVSWPLETEAVTRACAGQPQRIDVGALRDAGAAVSLDADAAGRPVPASLAAPLAGPVLIRVPRDIERLRAEDAALAREWRRALRAVLGGLLADGAHVVGFDKSGWYAVGRPAVADRESGGAQL